MNFVLISNIFPPHVRGGYELGCEIVARRLSGLGHTVTILTSAALGQLERTTLMPGLNVRPIFEPIFEYEELLDARTAQNPLWLRRRQEAFGGVLVGNVLALSDCLTEIRPDAVWFFNPLGLGTVGILEAALSQPVKCIIHLMDNIDGAVAGHQQALSFEGRYRRLKSHISAISCSRKTLLANERLGPYRSHRVIYNGICFDQIPCERTRPHADGVCRFVYFGQVSEPKGVLEMVRGAAHLRQASPEARFTLDIIGRCSSLYRKELERTIAENGLSGLVNLIPFMAHETLMAELTRYDAAVMLLSADEPFGYAPVEAAAAGLPVVMTPDAGSAECFPPDYPLFVQDRSKETEVAGKMFWCCRNLPELRHLGLALRSALQAYCDLDKVTIPGYLRVVRACPVSAGKFNIQGLLSSYYTARLYSQIA
jgi:glycosyltransferase involved in cell wall biosynthesis